MAPIANLTVRISAQIAELEKGLSTANQKLDGFGKQFNSVAGIAKTAGAAIAGAFTIQTLAAFGQDLLQMGDDIVRTSDRTGLLTDEVQKLSYIASQSGNSIDSLTGAIGQMQNRLASGDKSALAAVQQLGLSFDQLAKLSPFQQLEQIAISIAKIPNPAQRAQIAMDIFGRSGLEILPTLIANFKKLGDEAPLMSKNTALALDQAGDALNRFKLSIKVFAAESYNFLSRAMDAQIVIIQKAIAAFFDATASIVELAAKIPGASKALGTLGVSVESLRGKAEYYREAAKAMAFQTGEASRAATAAITPLVRLATTTDTAAKSARGLHTATKDSTKALADVRQSLDTLLPKVVYGIGNVRDFGEAFYGALIPAERFSELMPKVTSGIGNLLEELPKADLGYQFKIALPAIEDTWKGVDRLVQSLGQLGQVAGGTFGGMVRQIAMVIGSLNAANDSVEAFKKGHDDWKEGSTFQGILGMTTGILGMVSAAITAGKALANLFDRNKGRDLVVEFADSFGGFDALHEKLLTLGEAGEALWIKLTQGVGRNNPDQARRVIDEVTAALDKQETQQDQTTEATEEQAQATIETASQAAEALRELGDMLHTNEDEWSHWSSVATGAIQDVANSLRTLSIPNPTGGGGGEAEGAATGGFVSTSGKILRFALGGVVPSQAFSGGGLVRFMPHGSDTVPAMVTPGEGIANLRAMSVLGRDGLAMLNSGQVPSLMAGAGGPMHSTFIFEFDGKQFARGTAPHIPGEVRRLGLKVRSAS